MNSYKVPVKFEQIEDIIEKDFIDIIDLKSTIK